MTESITNRFTNSRNAIMFSMQKKLSGAAIAALFFLFQPVSAQAAQPYDGHVRCEGSKPCKIDIFLTKGFRTFSQCQVCHGLDGTGSTIAPNLMMKLQEIDHDTFIDRVTNGFKGQIGVMPTWKSNPNVMNNIENLYAYLKARSDKLIPAGRLARFDRGGNKTAVAAAPAKKTETSTSSAQNVIPASSGFGSRDALKKAKTAAVKPEEVFGSKGHLTTVE